MWVALKITRRMEWWSMLIYERGRKNAYKSLAGKLKVDTPRGRLGHRSKSDISA
jgi:hypothetical protein